MLQLLHDTFNFRLGGTSGRLLGEHSQGGCVVTVSHLYPAIVNSSTVAPFNYNSMRNAGSSCSSNCVAGEGGIEELTPKFSSGCMAIGPSVDGDALIMLLVGEVMPSLLVLLLLAHNDIGSGRV